MAKEKAPAKEAVNSEEELQKPKKKLPIKVIIIVLLVVLMEVGTILFMKMSSKPEAVEGDTTAIDQTAELPEAPESELMIVEDMSVDNWTTGKTKYLVNFSVAIKVDDSLKEKLTEKIAKHSSEIKQIFSQIVGEAEPHLLKDAKKEVISRKMKTELEAIIGDGVVKELLIPSWSSMPVE